MRRSGRLVLDPNRLARVHSRFAGQVETIGTLDPGLASVREPSAEGKPAPAAGASDPPPRGLRFGDPVRAGQLLAVVWSKDVGEKKSDLVNALSSLFMHRKQYERLRALDRGLITQRQLSEAEQLYEADLIAVDRIERTLRSWRIDETEIAEVRAEAERLHRGNGPVDAHLAETWAEVDIRAPFDGLLLEKNITIGDIVDTNLDLFKVGDLSSLLVMIDVFEEDLPAIEALSPEERRWTVRLKAMPHARAISGSFDMIGNIVDPMQHTVALMGLLDNPDGLLKAGQFVTAEIAIR